MAIKALTTLEALKVHLRIADTNQTQDDLLNQLIEGVSWAVRKRTNRDFNSARRTEYHDGNGTEYIHLIHRPVTIVEDADADNPGGVWLDANGFHGQAPNAFPAATKLVMGTDYFVETLEANERNPSRLVLITNPYGFGILNQSVPIGEAVRALWPFGRGNIKVVYTAGYGNIPDDLELAVHQLIAATRNGLAKGGPIKSETLGRYAYELMTGADLKGSSADLVTARSIIASYTECPL